MGYPCRCRKCWKRRTLRKRPGDYVRPIKCQGCGAINSMRVDNWRNSGKEAKMYNCTCGGLPYPHREGSSPFCRYSDREPTEQEIIDFNRSLIR